MVRVLQEYEIPAALSLARDVFGQYVAPGYTPEGNAEFEKSLDEQRVLAEVRARQVVFWGDFEQEYLVGMCAMTPNGHIRFFFVHSQWQHRGIGKQLLQAMYRYAFDQLHVPDISVNASPYAVGIYQRMGFTIVAPEQTVNGIRFTPMSMIKKRANAFWLIPVCVGGGVLLIALIVLSVLFVKRVQNNLGFTYNNRDGYYSYEDEYNYDDGYDDDYSYDDSYGNDHNSGDRNDHDDSYDEDTTGEGWQEHSLDQIPTDAAEGISYTTTKENYSREESQDAQSIDFDVDYPVISGMENEELQTKINEMIYAQATYMVDFMYTNPSKDVKEYIAAQRAAFGTAELMSDVEYSISYAREGFLSIVFEDHYYLGSEYSEFKDIRTLNINLDDGTTYDISDIIDVNDDFINAWLISAKNEVVDSMLFRKLTNDDFKGIMDGTGKNTFQYGRAFYVDADGMQVGFSYHFGDTEGIERGWLTAPFTLEEIEPYKTESDFWARISTAG